MKKTSNIDISSKFKSRNISASAVTGSIRISVKDKTLILASVLVLIGTVLHFTTAGASQWDTKLKEIKSFKDTEV